MTDYGGPLSPSNVAGYIRALIGEGENATRGLEIFRDAGGRIRTSRWYQMYGNVADAVARYPEVLGLDPHVIPGAGAYGTLEMGRGGQYATRVQVTILDRESGQYLMKWFTHVSSDPHTPAEAEEAAIAMFGDPADSTRYQTTVMGANAAGVYQTVAYAS